MTLSILTATKNALLNAYGAKFNGGTIELYAGAVPANCDAAIGGAVLLGTLTMGATAFAPAVNASITASAAGLHQRDPITLRVVVVAEIRIARMSPEDSICPVMAKSRTSTVSPEPRTETVQRIINMSDPITTHNKAAGSFLDYGLNWGSWLRPGEEILSAAWECNPMGLGLSRSSNDGRVTSIWCEGGEPGKTYALVCRITTSQDRIDERSIVISIKQR